jgi:SAM-dependent methyltransferase
MSNDASFIGNIPEHYERGLVPIFFVDYAADIARRTAAWSPGRVLEIAAGTGVVTRQLRDLLPAGAHLMATDLNPPMLAIARAKFRPNEKVDFRPADATTLPFSDGSTRLSILWRMRFEQNSARIRAGCCSRRSFFQRADDDLPSVKVCGKRGAILRSGSDPTMVKVRR